MKIEDIIVVDKDLLGGIPVFKGTRVPVKNLFDYLQAGDSLNDFLNDFEYIPREYCLAVLEVAELVVTNKHFEESPTPKAKPSDFKDKLNLTEEQYQDFQRHLKDIRSEWDNKLSI